MSIVYLIILCCVAWQILWIILGLKQMSPWSLRRRLAAGERIRIVDVRTHFEYKLLHIAQAESAPLFTGASFDKVMDLHGDPGGHPNVVVVSTSGQRSALLAWQFKQTGMKQSYNLVGGLLLWKLFGGATQQGLEKK